MKPVMLTRCDENVERLCSIDCSSPMSAKMSSKMLSAEPALHGMCRPHCVINASRPAVFNVTVLPPVFGPVNTMMCVLGSGSMSMGTTVAGSSSGCRARIRRSVARGPFSIAGSIASVSSAYFALAKITSMFGQRFDAPDDGLRVGGDEVGQHAQHAIDFVLFAHLQFAHLIVEFHRRQAVR